MTIDVKADLEALYTAIMARVQGRQVNSVGHGGRSMSYDGTDLKDMIKMYRMMWQPEYGLPVIPLDLETSTADRGSFRLRMR